MTSMEPRDLTPRTQLINGVWLHGIVVRMRTRGFDADTSPTISAGKATGKKGVGKKGAKNTARPPSKGFEMYLNGGKTPADVVMVETWEPSVVQRLQPLAQIGAALRITNAKVQVHSDKTLPWTTSRLQCYVQLTEMSKIENVTPVPDEWLKYHPITAVPDIFHLTDGRLLCVAGRVVEPAPAKKDVDIGGSTVPVANAWLMQGNDLISLVGWRDNANAIHGLEVGEFRYFHSVKKMRKSGGDKQNVELRYISISSVTVCPPDLQTELESTTKETSAGARVWTATTTGARGQSRDYAKEEASWFSLSVCRAIACPQERRQLTTLAQVPSVFITLKGNSITYAGCSECKKGYSQESQACTCSNSSQKIYWRAHLQLTDFTSSVTVTAFDAVESLAAVIPGDGPSVTTADDFHTSEDKLDDLMTTIAAIPFTVILSFEDSDYAGGTEMILRLVTPTYDEKKGVKHPLKPFLRCLDSSYSLPPCQLADTSFNAGAGLSIVPGGSVTCFRALLELMDKPGGLRRSAEETTLRITRRCACALRHSDDGTVYTLVQNGPLEITSRMLTPKQGDYVHALVCWRDDKAITLVAALELPTASVTTFRKFFDAETKLFRSMLDNDSTYVLQSGIDDTPLRISSAARDSAKSMATSQPWGERSAFDGGDF